MKRAVETIHLDLRGPEEHESGSGSAEESSDESSEAEPEGKREGKKITLNQQFGGVAEWSKAAVLKTAVPKGTRGSNPFSSADFYPSKPTSASSGAPKIWRPSSLKSSRRAAFHLSTRSPK